MSKVIRVGIAGYGRSGCGIHANWLKNDTDKYKVVAVADNIAERREDAKKDFDCEVYEDYKQLLENAKIDLFVNATPSRFHLEASKAALGKGINTLGEKPSAPTVKDYDELVGIAKANKAIFYPFQNSRFYPFFIKMQEIIKSGVLGDIVYIRSNWSGFARRWDWQTMQSELAGNLWNTGPHPVDQAVVLFGEEYPNVFCKMYANHFPFEGDAENFCLLVLTGENNPTVEVCISSVQAYPQGDMYNISGTLGGLTGGPSGLKWKYYIPEEAPKHEQWKPWSLNRQYCGEQLPWHNESWEYDDKNSNATGFSTMVRSLYANLYEVLANGAEPKIKLEQVRRQIYIMEEAHKQNPLPQKASKCIYTNPVVQK